MTSIPTGSPSGPGAPADEPISSAEKKSEVHGDPIQQMVKSVRRPPVSTVTTALPYSSQDVPSIEPLKRSSTDSPPPTLSAVQGFFLRKELLAFRYYLQGHLKKAAFRTMKVVYNDFLQIHHYLVCSKSLLQNSRYNVPLTQSYIEGIIKLSPREG